MVLGMGHLKREYDDDELQAHPPEDTVIIPPPTCPGNPAGGGKFRGGGLAGTAKRVFEAARPR
jgi:hypothetical protein